MKLIVGLGNPGLRFARNRHNVGFMLVDRLATSERAEWSRQRFNAKLSTINLAGERVLLCKPQSYMNLSGVPVGKLVAMHHIAHQDLLVVYDDLDLPLGRLRLRASGSAGGHHGMESILNVLGTTNIPRLRIGIGRPDTREDVRHVLGNFSEAERTLLEETLARAEAGIRTWVRDGIVRAMNELNR